MEPVRRYVGNALGTPSELSLRQGFKIDTVLGYSGIYDQSLDGEGIGNLASS